MSRQGDVLASLKALENLVVSCATFQEACGVENAEDARAFVYWPGQQPFEEKPGKGRKTLRTWPGCFAWVRFAQGAGIEVPSCKWTGGLELWVDLETPEDLREEPKQEAERFLAFVGKLLQDMAANSYGEGMPIVTRLNLNEVMKNDISDGRDSMEARIALEGLS